MNIYRFLHMTVFVCCSILLTHTAAYANQDDERCIDPTFRKFNPPNHAEVAPGSEISFHVKHADKHKIKVTAKKIPVEISIEDRNIFLIVTGKLPESLKGTYARISLQATAEKGCKGKDGWLLKISDGVAKETVEVGEIVVTDPAS